MRMIWLWMSLATISLFISACSRDQAYEALFSGKIEIVDLTYPLDPSNAFWPGHGTFPFRLDTLTTLPRDGFYSLAYHTPEHLGTHLDAPNFLIASAPAVDEISVKMFFAHAVVIDISSECSKNPDYQLRRDDVEIWEEVYRYIPRHTLVMVYTGWGARWGNSKQYFNYNARGEMHFPGVQPEAARFLLEERQIVGMGIDTPGLDGGQDKKFSTRKLLASAGKYVIENLANLDQVPARNARVVVAPIKIAGGSGSQVRVFAILP